jgi:hypothetical protein
MDKMCVSACEPAKPTRIMEIQGQLQALGSEVFELQRAVNENRKKYFGSQDVPDVSADKEESKGGTVNDIEWMIGDIKRMVFDIREYVEAL